MYFLVGVGRGGERPELAGPGRPGAHRLGRPEEVIVGAFIIAAVVTPPDVLSQLLLAIPMCILYELGLFIARFYLPKTESPDEKTA